MSEEQAVYRDLLILCADESYDYLRARPRPWWRFGLEAPPSPAEKARHLTAEKVRLLVLPHYRTDLAGEVGA